MSSAPGANEDGSRRFGTVNGTSAAAAVVAGAAAVLAHARPARDAQMLKGLLVGTARPIVGESVTAQGAGLVDLGAATAAELAADPASLTFTPVDGAGWHASQRFVVRNLSTRRLRIRVNAGDFGGAGLALTAKPAALTLKRNGRATVSLTARFTGPIGDGAPAEGSVELSAPGTAPIRIPWMVTFRTGAVGLLGDVELSLKSFRPSDTTPAVLSFRAGQLTPSPTGPDVHSLERLDLVLATDDGEKLGRLARLRNLLPGSYIFGLTGRDPNGDVLAPGRYRLRLVAVPTDGGPWSRRSVTFTIK